MPRGSKPGEHRGGRKPGTRNKRTLDLDALCREYSEPAIRTLAEIMNDKEAPHAARASAANSLLRKTVPDLQSNKVEVDPDANRLVIEIVRFNEPAA
jgi:hypothetical protein